MLVVGLLGVAVLAATLMDQGGNRAKTSASSSEQAPIVAIPSAVGGPGEEAKAAAAPPPPPAMVASSNGAAAVPPPPASSSSSSTAAALPGKKAGAVGALLDAVKEAQQGGEGMATAQALTGLCFAANMEELKVALATPGACSIISLMGGGGGGEGGEEEEGFVFTEEVLVTGRVVLQGNSITLPFLDCSLAERCFRVAAGGYLELRYVRINQSGKEDHVCTSHPPTHPFTHPPTHLSKQTTACSGPPTPCTKASRSQAWCGSTGAAAFTLRRGRRVGGFWA